MCSIVSIASIGPSAASSSQTPPEILWKDGNFTAYREKTFPVSSKGHVIVAFNLHVPSIYTLSSSDIPLLIDARSLATRLLVNLDSRQEEPVDTSTFRIGFITPPFKDNKIPVMDHLHLHAYILPADKLGWWRGVSYGAVAWYAIDDLIAEIRESVSNNRVKSGYRNRGSAPIDTVPYAGVRMGNADGLETTDSGLAALDLEDGQRTPNLRTPNTNVTSTENLSPDSSIPSLRV